MKTFRTLSLLVALMASVAVTGCWTDDDDTPAPVATGPGAVPDSAGTSSTSFVNFLSGLMLGDETSDPYTIPDSFAVPSDESADVKPLS
jgi:hypothetical protein